MCQSLFSVGDIFQQLNDSNNLRIIKGHFVLLLDEVCFEFKIYTVNFKTICQGLLRN
jgi:hypothetical protein